MSGRKGKLNPVASARKDGGVRLEVRLSAEEGDWLRTEAHSNDLSVSDYIRQRVLPPLPMSDRRKIGGDALPSAAGRVYFLQSGNEAKIGFTRQALGVRISTIRWREKREISLLASFPGVIADERRLQLAMAHYRIRGEWFELEPVLDLLRAGDFV